MEDMEKKYYVLSPHGKKDEYVVFKVEDAIDEIGFDKLKDAVYCMVKPYIGEVVGNWSVSELEGAVSVGRLATVSYDDYSGDWFEKRLEYYWKVLTE